MPETLVAPNGQQVPLDPGEVDFARAMAAPEPGEKPDYPAPPRRDPDAPHGRGPDGAPLAPYGINSRSGKPNLTKPGPGRPRTGNDKPREQKAGGKGAAGTGKPQPAPAAEDPAAARLRRAEDAQTSLELIGAGLSLFAMISSARAKARWMAAEARQDKKAAQLAAEKHEQAAVLQLDAAACSIHAESVGPSLAMMAEQNRWTAALVDRLSLFNGVASVGMTMLPLVYQLVANHAPKEARDNLPPELMTLGVLPPNLLMEKLAAQNAVKMARAQSDILRERAEAEAELAELQQQAAA